MTADALPPADAAVLAEMPGLESIELILADMNGLLRGKRIERSALEKVFSDGVCLPMSLIATDITGNTVEETGLGYDIGDEDRLCRPLPGTLRPVPWHARPSAQLLLGMEDAEGNPFAANPRQVLAQVLDRFHQRGLTPVVAIELEFYLLDQVLTADGMPQTPRNPATGRRNLATQVYYLQDLQDYREFTDAVASACAAQAIPADTAVAEYAPGQFEINLKHRPDALRACDDAIMLKRAIKAVAADQGLLASFMAKPFTGQAGSGLHIHVSLLDRDGGNLFAGTPEEPADALRHAVAGLQASAADCMLLFAPNGNSYRRFVANAFVPLNDQWGFNNRTVALRIPYSNPANTRIEHRIAGADANVYLAAAAVLAGVLDGLDTLRDPGPATVGNAYEQAPPRELSWQQAQAEFAGSEFVGERLGREFQRIYTALKKKELESFNREVTSLDVDWYLRQV